MTPPLSNVATFTDIELLGCYILAQKRNAKAQGVRSQKLYHGANDLVTNYVGVKAEYAVARLTGAAMNLTVFEQGGGSTHLTVAGHRVLVRASDDLLIFNSAADFDADVAVLVSPHGSERDPWSRDHPRHWARNVVIKGYVTREEFLARAVERDLGYGKRLTLRDGQLHPLRELLEPQPVAMQLALV